MKEILCYGKWILGLNAAVASHIYKRVQCRRQRRPTEGQKIEWNLLHPLYTVAWIALGRSQLRKEERN